MKTITITLADDGSSTVEAEIDGQAQPPYSCESIDECLEHVRELLAGDQASEPDAESMWNEEAGRRADMRAMQAGY